MFCCVIHEMIVLFTSPLVETVSVETMSANVDVVLLVTVTLSSFAVKGPRMSTLFSALAK